MDKTLLNPGSGTEYESNICDLEETIFNSINEGSTALSDDSDAYEFYLDDLDYEFPDDEDDRNQICSDIKDELDFRLQSYSEALAAHNANSEEPEASNFSYAPAEVWIEDETLYVKF